MINVSLCWFNFRTRKRGCRSYSVFNSRNEATRGESRQSELHNASKSSWKTFSATSRRGALTSRRQIVIPLPRRDVDFPRRDVILTLLCHVATCTVTSRRQTVKLSVTSRRGILTSRRGILTLRRHFPTSRRHLVRLSATSRRCPARRDVALFLA